MVMVVVFVVVVVVVLSQLIYSSYQGLLGESSIHTFFIYLFLM